MSAFADKQIKCLECQKDFTYTAAEQELHKSLGYQNEPKRCNACREAKRQRRPGGGRERAAAPAVEGGAPAPAAPPPAPRPPQNRPPQQQRPPQGGGRRDQPRGGGGQPPRPPKENRGGGGPGADPGFAPRENFLAICAECGKEAVLPFKPRGDRPVLCIECFAQKRTG